MREKEREGNEQSESSEKGGEEVHLFFSIYDLDERRGATKKQ